MKRIATLAINQNGKYKSRYFLCDEKYNDGKNNGLYVDFAWGNGISYGNLDDKNYLNRIIEDCSEYTSIPWSDEKIKKAIEINNSNGLVDAIIFLFDLEEVSISDIITKKFNDVYYDDYLYEFYLSSNYDDSIGEEDFDDNEEFFLENNYNLTSDNLFAVSCGLDIDEEFHIGFTIFNTLEEAKNFLEMFKDGDIEPYNYMFNSKALQSNYGKDVTISDIQNLVLNNKTVTFLEQEIYLGRDMY